MVAPPGALGEVTAEASAAGGCEVAGAAFAAVPRDGGAAGSIDDGTTGEAVVGAAITAAVAGAERTDVRA